ncbi:MAG TPA: OsmC family peroxiredoxin [Longimicrobiales bacterium]|nr:OsmC family peroxiredoxin [Longimicrobiales bacterium]
MANPTESMATAVWNGSLMEGKGRVRVASGAFGELPMTWAARTERGGASSSPEELIAAAHATCFSMALSHGLSQKGHPPRQLDVTARCTFVPGPGITTMRLSVVGDVPGLDEAGFAEAANAAKDGCPVSKALKGNVDVQVEAKLKR